MANQPNSKLKLLYLLEILQEKTDDLHALSAQEIIEELAVRGIDAARKSVYRDIEVLRDAGFEIEVRREPYAAYALKTRPFDLQEMVLLVDVVQSSPFLTEEMTDHLIERIGALASTSQRKMLARRIDVPSRVKMQNESVFANLDKIQYAMRVRRRIRFRYFTYDAQKNKVPRRDGEFYRIDPVRLVYADGFYYLVSFSSHWDDWVVYRVDRMLDIEVTDEPIPRNAKAASYDPTDREALAFGVYNSKKDDKSVAATFTLLDPSAMQAVVDRFGPEVDTAIMKDGSVRVRGRVIASPQFFGWLFSLHGVLRLDAPKRLVDAYRTHLEQAIAAQHE